MSHGRVRGDDQVQVAHDGRSVCKGPSGAGPASSRTSADLEITVLPAVSKDSPQWEKL
jgi:hypothetical protein